MVTVPTLPLFQRYRTPVLWGLGLVLFSMTLAAVWARFTPPAKSSSELAEIQERMKRSEETTQKLVSAFNQSFQQNQELKAKTDQTAKTLANVASQTHEVIYRYPPQGSGNNGSSPAPVINVLPAPVQTYPGGAHPDPAQSTLPSVPSLPVNPWQPVEIVVRDTRTDDKSVTGTHVGSEASSGTETRTETHGNTVADTNTKTDTTTDTRVKSSTKTETGSKSPDPGFSGRLGAGVLMGQKGGPSPFASYDLFSKPLGPPVLGLNKIRMGAGLFVTKSGLGSGGIDGGPQLNVGKGSVFGMLGYRVREKDPVIGIGLHARF